MSTMHCPHCGLEQPASHTFCLTCGARLPKELLRLPAKTSRWFAGIKVGEGDPEGAYLRVSCYREDQIFEAPEGEVRIPGHHVRFSVWSDKEARCVVSIPESEARELAAFVEQNVGRQSDQRNLSAQ
jgi:hypothetical protein